MWAYLQQSGQQQVAVAAATAGALATIAAAVTIKRVSIFRMGVISLSWRDRRVRPGIRKCRASTRLEGQAG